MKQNTVFIRRANQDDVDLLAAFGATVFYQSFAHENSEADMVTYLHEAFALGKIAAELEQPGSTFFIAEQASLPVGYARILSGSREECISGSMPIELVRIYASPEWVGKGIGSMLMQACLDEAKRSGHDIIWLGVWHRNERAIAFYQRWGFVKAGTHTFQLGSDAQVDWIMQRSLIDQ